MLMDSAAAGPSGAAHSDRHGQPRPRCVLRRDGLAGSATKATELRLPRKEHPVSTQHTQNQYTSSTHGHHAGSTTRVGVARSTLHTRPSDAAHATRPMLCVPLAGYCTECHRPAALLVIYPTVRHIVHTDASYCRAANPPPR